VEESGGAAEALIQLNEKPFDAVLTDLRMDRRDDGLLLARVVKSRWRLPVVLYTTFGNPDDYALAAELGVEECCVSSEPGNVTDAVRRVIRKHRPQPAALAPLTPVSMRVRWERPIALSWNMQQVLQKMAHVAPEELPVLITGETGVGKDLVAREIHRRSNRCKQPFVALNCGAIAEHLMESELFGHCRGAFTGAEANKPGLVEEAHRGTLFLDEVTELPLKMQVAMLRFLESGEFRRLGETATRKVNVRIIAATNQSVVKFRPKGARRFRVIGGHFEVVPADQAPRF
jgi:DNA-binding NtrC family response regulator